MSENKTYDAQHVKELAAQGLNINQIAARLRLHPDAQDEDFKTHACLGRIDAMAEIAKCLYKLATETDNNLRAIELFIKTFGFDPEEMVDDELKHQNAREQREEDAQGEKTSQIRPRRGHRAS